MRTWLRDNRGVLVFLVCFAFFRSAVADWNPIPSGSMRPTILEGDVVLVNRLAYDFKIPLTDIALASFADPKRGDIVTFSSPRDGTRLIKRIVAVPGDTVEMRAGTLFIDNVAAQYASPSVVPEPLDYGGTVASVHAIERIAGDEHPVQFLPGVHSKRDFDPFVVPGDSYFMLGDNRDNSQDSRYIGVVSRRLLIGRANRLLVSADIKGHWLPRIERIGKVLD